MPKETTCLCLFLSILPSGKGCNQEKSHSCLKDVDVEEQNIDTNTKQFLPVLVDALSYLQGFDYLMECKSSRKLVLNVSLRRGVSSPARRYEALSYQIPTRGCFSTSKKYGAKCSVIPLNPCFNYSKEVKELSIQTYAFFVVFPFLIAAHPVTFQDLHRSPSIRLRHVKTVLFLKDYLAFWRHYQHLDRKIIK